MARCLTRPTAAVLIAMFASVAAAGTPTWQCWGAGLPDPCRNQLNAVTVVPESGGGEAWAAGESGTILNGHGSVWRRSEAGSPVRLVDIAMAAPDRGWAVGDEGTLLQWRGATWTEVTGLMGDDTQVRAVAVVPGSDRPQAWAAADWMGFGTFYRYTGSFWSETEETYSGVVKDIEMVADDVGWAVSYSIGDAVFYRWDGARWEAVEWLETGYSDLAFVDAEHGWAVGAHGALATWDGAAWTEHEPISNSDLYGVAAIGPDDVWAAGSCGTLVHWDGATWQEVRTSVGCIDFNGIAFAGPSLGWMVGDAGIILRYDGARWTSLNAPGLYSIDDLELTPGTDDDLWAAGSGGRLLHFDGYSWSPVTGSASYYYSVAMLDPNNGWANGGRAFHHWDGYGWTKVQDADSARDMVMVGSDEGWAVGWSTLQHWDGSQWAPVEPPIDTTYSSIAASGPDDVWATGSASGVMAHYDGNQWRTVEVPDIGMVGELCLVEPGLGYAVGGEYGSGGALQMVGGDWVPLSVPSSSPSLNAVDVRRFGSALSGWMVGDDGFTLRMSGGLWLAEPTPTQSDLLAVATVSPTEAWATGRNGVILHWHDSAAPQAATGSLIPASAKLAGQAGTDWRTDLTIVNLGSENATVTIEGWLRDHANPDPERRTLALAPLACVVAEDVLGGLFGLPDSSAASLLVESGQPLAIASRTYNDAPEGTYGQSIPATALSRVFGVGQVAAVIGLEETSKARSNLGIVNPSDATIEVLAEFYGAGGMALGSRTYSVPARGAIQRTRVLEDVGAGSTEAAWARVRSADGPFMAYASTVDASTGDPVYRSAVATEGANLDGVLQGMARVAGAAGTDWKSTLALVNTAERASTVVLGLMPRDQPNPAPEEVSITLDPMEIRTVDDVLGELFGMTSGAASISVFTQGSTLVAGRTFNQTDHGTYGQFIPVQTRGEAILLGSRGVLVGVTQNGRFRSNLGLTNSPAATSWVALTLWDRDGIRVGDRQSLKLRPGEVVQIDRVAELFGVTSIEGATLIVEPSTGVAVDAFLSIVDSRTGDPVFLVPTVD